ncbi:MAG: ATP phosphoribosyltransferase regulatory subunit, partial [Candidatus Kaiserbacteria bacterium]|nr:ATP phosphoribosyltransferase regulatory subunit [Candidatus Kaiserbacteria bacterium]
LKAFGAKDEDFEIRVNDRREMREIFEMHNIKDPEAITTITRLNDRFHKISKEEYISELTKITQNEESAELVHELIGAKGVQGELTRALSKLGINNVVVDRSIARGFDYYTGTIFEIFDTSKDNNRSLIGGGRYDNLTSLFGGDPISGIGFGMGDVTMRDFLETHGLLENRVPATAPTVIVIPNDASQNIEAQKVAQEFRTAGIKITVDISDRKADKKKGSAEKAGAKYILTFTDGDNTFSLRTLKSKVADIIGTTAELIKHIK